MSFSTILVDKAEGIATLTLNRPDRLNAVTEPMTAELLDAFTQIESDGNVRVLVITGAGRGFCAGADIQDLFLKGIEDERQGKEKFDLPAWAEKACWQLADMSKPTIASINGPAVGFGMTLTLVCDLRIASEEARLSIPFVQFGIIPEFGSTYFLPRLVGIAKACELAFTGRFIEAKEAKEIGLVNEVVPGAELKAATYKLAKSIVRGAPVAIQLAKRGLYQGLDTSLRNQLRYERLALDIAFQSEDHAEAVAAFLQKRPPVFKGK